MIATACCCNDAVVTSGFSSNVSIYLGGTLRTRTVSSISVYLSKSLLTEIYNYIVDNYGISSIMFGSSDTDFACVSSFLSPEFKIYSDGSVVNLSQFRFYNISDFPFNSYYNSPVDNLSSPLGLPTFPLPDFVSVSSLLDFLKPFVGSLPLFHSSKRGYLPNPSYISSELESFYFCYSNIDVNKLLSN